MELPRLRALRALDAAFERSPAVALLGPRQVGKTTLAAQFASRSSDAVTRFDLENPRDLSRLEDPMGTLEGLRGLVVLDEIQRRPELFPVLRVLLDRPANPARFLILGSAGPALLRQSSETLAGRIAFQELSGFDLEDTGVEAVPRRWLRGGFPRSFLAASDAESLRGAATSPARSSSAISPSSGSASLPPRLASIGHDHAHARATVGIVTGGSFRLVGHSRYVMITTSGSASVLTRSLCHTHQTTGDRHARRMLGAQFGAGRRCCLSRNEFWTEFPVSLPGSCCCYRSRAPSRFPRL